MRASTWGLALAAVLSGCAAPPPPPPPAPAPVAYAAPDTVWTRGPSGAPGDTLSVTFPRPFVRLEVLGADSASLLVRCGACADTVARRVPRERVVHRVLPPDSVADASVEEFALAVRQAAATRDLVALRPLMSLDFAFSSIGAYGRDLALSSWISDNFRVIDRVPGLLDAGLTPLDDWWVAPDAYASVQDYAGLRLGFRRTAEGKWEWVFLMRGESDGI